MADPVRHDSSRLRLAACLGEGSRRNVNSAASTPPHLKQAPWDAPPLLAILFFHLGALGAFVPAFFSWNAVLVAGILHITGGLGVTLGFHRLLTHRSLRVPRFVEYFLAILGATAMQGGVIDWVASHRKHHAYTDREGDPHSIRNGFQWAHMDWLYRPNKALVKTPDFARWVPDLVQDPFYRRLDRSSSQIAIQALLALVLFFIGGWSFVIWGIFVRVVATWHTTWLVNSASHTYGYQTFHSNDCSTNCWWVGWLALGEGWHNNHHAFPFSARHGLQWFEIDATWTAIRALEILGIATHVKVPTPEMLKKLRLESRSIP